MKKVLLVLFVLVLASCGGNETAEPPAPTVRPSDRQEATVPPGSTGAESTIPAESTEDEPEAAYVNLRLPLTVQERTFGDDEPRRLPHITSDGVLQWHHQPSGRGAFELAVIDTDVRMLNHFDRELNRDRFYVLLYIKNDNTVWGVGRNDDGILGDGTGVNRDEPVFIMDDAVFVDVFMHGRGGHVALAIRSDRTLWQWGRGVFSPVQIAEDVAGFVGISGRSGYITYQDSAGFIYRQNEEGEFELLFPEPVYSISPSIRNLGDGLRFGLFAQEWVYYINSDRNLIRRDIREQGGAFVFDEPIIIDYDVAEFFCEGDNVFYIKSDGTLWGFGANENGELGDGTRVPRPEPVQIAEDVVVAREFGFLRRDGTYWTWNSDNPEPQQIYENVAFTNRIDHYGGANVNILFQDGTLSYTPGNWVFHTERENVRIPQTLTFD